MPLPGADHARCFHVGSSQAGGRTRCPAPFLPAAAEACAVEGHIASARLRNWRRARRRWAIEGACEGPSCPYSRSAVGCWRGRLAQLVGRAPAGG